MQFFADRLGSGSLGGLRLLGTPEPTLMHGEGFQASIIVLPDIEGRDASLAAVGRAQVVPVLPTAVRPCLPPMPELPVVALYKHSQDAIVMRHQHRSLDVFAGGVRPTFWRSQPFCCVALL